MKNNINVIIGFLLISIGLSQVREVLAYRTTDGKYFNDLRNAVTHEKRERLSELFEPFYYIKCYDGDEGELLDWILNNQNRIVDVLTDTITVISPITVEWDEKTKRYYLVEH